MSERQKRPRKVAVLSLPAAPRLEIHGPMPVPVEIITAWDNVDSSINRVICALPCQMTEMMANLERDQKAFRKALFDAIMGRVT